MTNAPTITVMTAPPYLTVQDLGRTGYRASGVPPSGVMDVPTMRTVNALVGNPPDAAVLEWAIAGGTLRFERTTVIALGGADVTGTLGGVPIVSQTPLAVAAGTELRIERLVCGRFVYIAVQGGIDVPRVLGSRSTNIVAAFGGVEGRRLRRGDSLSVGNAVETSGAPHPALTRSDGDTTSDAVVRIVRGPQHAAFDTHAWSVFLSATYTVAHASDRMGYRLDGPALQHSAGAALLSEPTCVGAVQVPDGGTPIVLMPDGPTIGGYPKIAVVIRADLGHLAQRMPGAPVRFTLMDSES